MAVSKKVSTSTKSSHPSYQQMISKAISTLKERTGSSRQSIKKYVVSQYKLDESKANHLINSAIKKGADSGSFVLPKGASGRVKLSKPVPKEGEKKPAAKKASSPKKKPAAKKATAVKKTATASAESDSTPKVTKTKKAAAKAKKSSAAKSPKKAKVGAAKAKKPSPKKKVAAKKVKAVKKSA